jgi:AAA15 family ATPase/GTPase
MISKISFTNYKCFKEKQELELKPLTILIGKNSSGKSAIAKLPVLIENSLSGITSEPFSFKVGDIEFGTEYRDIFYGKPFNGGILSFGLESEEDNLKIDITLSSSERNPVPIIYRWILNDSFNLIYNNKKNIYKNEVDDEEYKCSFSGVILDYLFYENRDGSGDIPSFEDNFNLKTNYIGPFRVFAQEKRLFLLSSGNANATVGSNGELAYQILAKESLETQSDLLESVSKWFKENFEGWGINVDKDKKPYYSINLFREKPKLFSTNIADVGQGISQALPLVVSAYIRDNSRLTIIEQPELHLHPAAHGNLAQLFADTAKQFGKKYLIETHSQNFVLRLRRLVAEGKLDKNDLAIYWVDNDEETNASTLKKINVNDLGEVDFWPENVFSESLDETIAIRSAQIKKKQDDSRN